MRPYRQHRWGRHRYGAAAWYVRKSLHRRIFGLLGFSILMSVLAVSLVFHMRTAAGAGTRPPHGIPVVPIVVFGVVLWAGSGILARRLTRPYTELARVARDIGDGKLSSRYDLHCGRQADEARVLAEAINDMADRIEKQMADQRELLAAVSHEIRTPLSRIRLLVELARGGQGTSLDAKTLDEVDREVNEIDALVGELLASARLDFAALSPRPLDAREVALRALERAGLDASLLRMDAPTTRFDGDPTLLARALANLLDNARRHAGGVEALRVGAEGGRIVFEALDRGPGFAPGEEGKVFERFYRPSASAGAAEAGSLGLGLSLVKRIAVAHGGTAFAKSRAGGGACVGIELPTSPS